MHHNDPQENRSPSSNYCLVWDVVHKPLSLIRYIFLLFANTLIHQRWPIWTKVAVYLFRCDCEYFIPEFQTDKELFFDDLANCLRTYGHQGALSFFGFQGRTQGLSLAEKWSYFYTTKFHNSGPIEHFQNVRNEDTYLNVFKEAVLFLSSIAQRKHILNFLSTNSIKFNQSYSKLLTMIDMKNSQYMKLKQDSRIDRLIDEIEVFKSENFRNTSWDELIAKIYEIKLIFSACERIDEWNELKPMFENLTEESFIRLLEHFCIHNHVYKHFNSNVAATTLAIVHSNLSIDERLRAIEEYFRFGLIRIDPTACYDQDLNIFSVNCLVHLVRYTLEEFSKFEGLLNRMRIIQPETTSRLFQYHVLNVCRKDIMELSSRMSDFFDRDEDLKAPNETSSFNQVLGYCFNVAIKQYKEKIVYNATPSYLSKLKTVFSIYLPVEYDFKNSLIEWIEFNESEFFMNKSLQDSLMSAVKVLTRRRLPIEGPRLKKGTIDYFFEFLNRVFLFHSFKSGLKLETKLNCNYSFHVRYFMNDDDLPLSKLERDEVELSKIEPIPSSSSMNEPTMDDEFVVPNIEETMALINMDDGTEVDDSTVMDDPEVLPTEAFQNLKTRQLHQLCGEPLPTAVKRPWSDEDDASVSPDQLRRVDLSMPALKCIKREGCSFIYDNPSDRLNRSRKEEQYIIYRQRGSDVFVLFKTLMRQETIEFVIANSTLSSQTKEDWTNFTGCWEQLSLSEKEFFSGLRSGFFSRTEIWPSDNFVGLIDGNFKTAMSAILTMEELYWPDLITPLSTGAENVRKNMDLAREKTEKNQITSLRVVFLEHYRFSINTAIQQTLKEIVYDCLPITSSLGVYNLTSDDECFKTMDVKLNSYGCTANISFLNFHPSIRRRVLPQWSVSKLHDTSLLRPKISYPQMLNGDYNGLISNFLKVYTKSNFSEGYEPLLDSVKEIATSTSFSVKSFNRDRYPVYVVHFLPTKYPRNVTDMIKVKYVFDWDHLTHRNDFIRYINPDNSDAQVVVIGDEPEGNIQSFELLISHPCVVYKYMIVQPSTEVELYRQAMDSTENCRVVSLSMAIRRLTGIRSKALLSPVKKWMFDRFFCCIANKFGETSTLDYASRLPNFYEIFMDNVDFEVFKSSEFNDVEVENTMQRYLTKHNLLMNWENVIMSLYNEKKLNLCWSYPYELLWGSNFSSIFTIPVPFSIKYCFLPKMVDGETQFDD